MESKGAISVPMSDLVPRPSQSEFERYAAVRKARLDCRLRREALSNEIRVLIRPLEDPLTPAPVSWLYDQAVQSGIWRPRLLAGDEFPMQNWNRKMSPSDLFAAYRGDSKDTEEERRPSERYSLDEAAQDATKQRRQLRWDDELPFARYAAPDHWEAAERRRMAEDAFWQSPSVSAFGAEESGQSVDAARHTHTGEEVIVLGTDQRRPPLDPLDVKPDFAALIESTRREVLESQFSGASFSAKASSCRQPQPPVVETRRADSPEMIELDVSGGSARSDSPTATDNPSRPFASTFDRSKSDSDHVVDYSQSRSSPQRKTEKVLPKACSRPVEEETVDRLAEPLKQVPKEYPTKLQATVKADAPASSASEMRLGNIFESLEPQKKERAAAVAQPSKTHPMASMMAAFVPSRSIGERVTAPPKPPVVPIIPIGDYSSSSTEQLPSAASTSDERLQDMARRIQQRKKIKESELIQQLAATCSPVRPSAAPAGGEASSSGAVEPPPSQPAALADAQKQRRRSQPYHELEQRVAQTCGSPENFAAESRARQLQQTAPRRQGLGAVGRANTPPRLRMAPAVANTVRPKPSVGSRVAAPQLNSLESAARSRVLAVRKRRLPPSPLPFAAAHFNRAAPKQFKMRPIPKRPAAAVELSVGGSPLSRLLDRPAPAAADKYGDRIVPIVSTTPYVDMEVDAPTPVGRVRIAHAAASTDAAAAQPPPPPPPPPPPRPLRPSSPMRKRAAADDDLFDDGRASEPTAASNGEPKRKRVRFASPSANRLHVYSPAPPATVAAETTAQPLDELLPTTSSAVSDAPNPNAMIVPPSALPSDQLSLEDRVDLDILRWQPQWLSQYKEGCAVLPPLLPELKERLEKLRAHSPVRFRNVDDYCQAMLPVFMCELWESVYSEYKETRERSQQVAGMLEYSFVVEKVQQMNPNFKRFIVDGVFVRGVAPMGLASEAALCRVDLEDGGKAVSVLAIVKRHSIHTLRSAADAPTALRSTHDVLRQANRSAAIVRLHLELRVKAKLNVTKAALHTVNISPVAGLLSARRPLLGLSSLPASPLAPLLLQPTEESFNIHAPYIGDIGIHSEGTSYNGSQKAVIQSFARDVFEYATEPRVGLVHGPPGTGKSRTIVGLVEEIKRLKKQSEAAGVILLTAPSNGAVDELARKLMQRNRELETQDDQKFLSVIRFGSKEQVAADVRCRLLEVVAEWSARRERDPAYLAEELKYQVARRQETISKSDKTLAGQEAKRRDAEQRIADVQLKMKRAQESGPQPTPKEIAEQKRVELLAADVILTTLNSSGHAALDILIEKKVPVLCVIVDEACQATELESLIPLRFGARKLFLVGDPCQLPPTILSKALDGVGLSGSAFVRCWNALSAESRALSVKFLDEQYRMVADIVHFPNKFTYDNRLKTAPSLKAPSSLLLNPYLVYDLNYGSEDRTSTGSFRNLPEIVMVRELCNFILEKSCLSSLDIGVISFYKSQVKELRDAFTLDDGLRQVEINTVDGFQGREKAAIVLSCVRSNRNSVVGFLGDNRRLNVAITRAKYALYIVGSRKTLSQRSDNWKQLLEDADQRGLIHTVKDSRQSVQLALSRLLPRAR